jgi:general stress protein CsbA
MAGNAGTSPQLIAYCLLAASWVCLFIGIYDLITRKDEHQYIGYLILMFSILLFFAALHKYYYHSLFILVIFGYCGAIAFFILAYILINRKYE